MASRDQQPRPFPTVPAQLSPDDHELRDWQAGQAQDIVPQPAPTNPTELTPYLGLRARLSQVWINRWTILLILILARVLIAISQLDTNLNSARREALSACSGVESMGSAMASMPHYMAQGVNEIAATGVEKAVNGLMSMLTLSVTAVEEIVLFVINLLTATYVCLITLAVRGAFDVALGVIKDVSSFLNQTLGDISNEIVSDVKGFQDQVNKLIGQVTSLGGLLGSSKNAPQIDITSSTDKLKDLQLPSGLNEGLDKLNSSIPTFDQVHNFTNNAIKLPFEEIKKLINSTMVAYKFDRSVFPVPAKEQLNFCSDNNDINGFFDRLLRIKALALKIFLVVICFLAVLACVPMAYREIWQWRTLNKRAQLIHKHAFDPLDVIQIAARPYSSTIGIKAASKFKSTRRQILVRWCIAYGTTLPALFVLCLGLAGLLACLCQYILLKSIEKEVPAIANEVGNFAGMVVTKLNNASEQWAIGTNRAIDATSSEINNELLGWVNTSTTAVNSTLNQFVDGMSDVLNTTFGGTILYEPIKDVLNCLIGLKIAGIQKALTWVHDNAHVDFPHLRNDTFSLGAALSIASDNSDVTDSFLADPNSAATDKITSTIVRVTNSLQNDIRIEAIIAAVLIGIWVFICIIGLIRTLILFARRDKLRAEGGGSAFTGEYRETFSEKGSPRSPPARQFPVFGAPVSSVAQTNSTIIRDAGEGNEKMGYAGERNDHAVGGSGHTRQSSYGYVADPVEPQGTGGSSRLQKR